MRVVLHGTVNDIRERGQITLTLVPYFRGDNAFQQLVHRLHSLGGLQHDYWSLRPEEATMGRPGRVELVKLHKGRQPVLVFGSGDLLKPEDFLRGLRAAVTHALSDGRSPPALLLALSGQQAGRIHLQQVLEVLAPLSEAIHITGYGQERRRSPETMGAIARAQTAIATATEAKT